MFKFRSEIDRWCKWTHLYCFINYDVRNCWCAETFDLYVDDGDAGTDHYIYKTQALGANETFEHTGRIVLEGTDMLGIIASSGDLDVVVSYLDQTL